MRLGPGEQNPHHFLTLSQKDNGNQTGYLVTLSSPFFLLVEHLKRSLSGWTDFFQSSLWLNTTPWGHFFYDLLDIFMRLLLRTAESELSWRSLWDSIILQCSFPSGWYIPRQFSTRKDLMPRLLMSFGYCLTEPGGVGQWEGPGGRGLNLLLCNGDKGSHLAGRRL